MVKYTNKKTKRRQPKQDFDIGPQRYFPSREKVDKQPTSYTFKKEQRIKKPTLDDLDLRTDLEVDLKLTKARSKNTIIMPEKKRVVMPDLDELQRGPGRYNIERKLVERDQGKGVPIFQGVTEENDRLKQMKNLTIREVPEGIIFPNFDYNKPQKLVFKYHDPLFEGYASKDKKVGPRNLPDKVFQQERFLFYNKDVKVIKESVVVHHFGRKLQYKEFTVKQKKLESFIAYLKYLQRNPEHNQYNPQHTLQERELQGIDFDKQLLRPIAEESDSDLEEQDIEGDVLLLDPQLPKKHVPNIKWDKQKTPDMVGLDEMDYEERVEKAITLTPEELLNQEWPAPDPRKSRLNPCMVKMDKQTGRKTPEELDSAEDEPIYFEEEEKPEKPGISPWDKQTGRESPAQLDTENENDFVAEEELPQKQEPIKKELQPMTKQAIWMKKDLPNEDGQETAKNIDYDKGWYATQGKIKGGGFGAPPK